VIDLARRDGRMLRIGHRGAATLAPENTIESLRLAIELGCDLVEFDVHEVEGTLVLAHDPPIGPAAELPMLDEALAFLAGTEAGAHLDLKASGAEEAVADALRRHGLVERTVVSSFRAETLRALGAAEPGVRLGLTYPEDRRGLVQRRGVAPFIGPALGAMRAVLPLRIGHLLAGAGASAAMLHFAVASEAVVERCHAIGAPVLVWTVDEQPWVARLDAMGVDGVITNDPRIFGARLSAG
jgi:glycerophosphoryl diester phosphodiesterase